MILYLRICEASLFLSLFGPYRESFLFLAAVSFLLYACRWWHEARRLV